jgi:hypothetical protein
MLTTTLFLQYGEYFFKKKITMCNPAASSGVARMALGLLIRSKLRGIRPGKD